MKLLVPFSIYDASQCVFGGEECGTPYELYEKQLIRSDVVLIGEGRGAPTGRGDPLAQQDYEFILKAWNTASPMFSPVKTITLPEGEQLAVYVKRPFNKIPSPMKGPDAHLRILLKEGASPHGLILRHLPYHPPGTEAPRFSVSVNGAIVATISETPPLPPTTLVALFPRELDLNGTLDVLITNESAVDENGIWRGIAIDWFSVICEQDSDCIQDWTMGPAE